MPGSSEPGIFYCIFCLRRINPVFDYGAARLKPLNQESASATICRVANAHKMCLPLANSHLGLTLQINN